MIVITSNGNLIQGGLLGRTYSEELLERALLCARVGHGVCVYVCCLMEYLSCFRDVRCSFAIDDDPGRPSCVATYVGKNEMV